MRAFQDEGHTGVLIIGDYTTRIGDPSGRSAERPILTDEEIDANAKTLPRAGDGRPRSRPHRGAVQRRVAREARSYADVVRLARTITVARILERDDFAKRMAAQEPISVSELLYPLMQAYDSVAIEADVELGGTDQLYNLLAGREVMPHYGLEPQVVLTTPLLLSWDGDEDELVGRQQHPADRAARGDVRPDDADPGRPARRSGGGSSPSSSRRPASRWRRSSRSRAASSRARTARRRRAAAEEHFTRVVRERRGARGGARGRAARRRSGAPAGAPRRAGSASSSTSEARRLIEQGGVKLNGEPAAELDLRARRARRARCSRSGSAGSLG